jgi:hypothetical protein
MTKSITLAERQTRDFAEKKYTVGSRSRRLGLAGCELAASESGARVGGCVCHLSSRFFDHRSLRDHRAPFHFTNG